MQNIIIVILYILQMSAYEERQLSLHSNLLILRSQKSIEVEEVSEPKTRPLSVLYLTHFKIQVCVWKQVINTEFQILCKVQHAVLKVSIKCISAQFRNTIIS